MYCKRCGQFIQNDVSFCQFCGCKVDQSPSPKPTSGAETVWKVFARIGRISGIVSIPLSVYTFGLVAIEGLVLSIIALRANDEKVRGEAKAGVILNAIALAIGLISTLFCILFIIVSYK